MTKQRKIWARYVGDGEYIPGVPARDLTKTEYNRHKVTIQANEQATGRQLYRLVTEEK